jgi:ATP-binding cassette subfamily C protein CydC
MPGQIKALFAPHWRGLLTSLGLSIIALLAGVFLSAASGWLVMADSPGSQLAGTVAIAVAVIGCSRVAARYGEKLLGHSVTLRLLGDIRAWLFSRLFPLLPIDDPGARRGDTVARLTSDVDSIDTMVLVAGGPLVGAIAVGLALATLVHAIVPGAVAAFAATYAMAVFGVPAIAVAMARRWGAVLTMRRGEYRAALTDMIEGRDEWISMGVTGTVQQAVDDAARDLAEAGGRLSLLSANAGAIVQALVAFAFMAVLWYGLQAWDEGTIQAPALLGLVMAVLGSVEATSAVARSTGRLAAAFGAARRLAAIGAGTPAIPDAVAPRALPDDMTIAMEGVGLARAGATPVFDKVDLVITPGERIVLTGPSGSGKSTLLALMIRTLDPTAGSVSLGGVPLQRLALGDVHSTVSLLSQDTALFHESVRDNLLVGRPGADDADLWAALEAAQLGEMVRSMPAGLDTVIGESGSTVSAGEARRLCLARVLLSKARILLMDEPTAGLDRASEEAFFAALETVADGRTVVVATHARVAGAFHRHLVLAGGCLEAVGRDCPHLPASYTVV